MSTLTAAEVARLVLHYGFANPDIAVAIALDESDGRTRVVNDKNNNPPGSRDRGLWQLNDHWHPGVTDEQAFDPAWSTQYVHGVTNGGRDWSCWRYGPRGRCNMGSSRNLRNLARARAAIANPAPATVAPPADDGGLVVGGGGGGGSSGSHGEAPNRIPWYLVPFEAFKRGTDADAVGGAIARNVPVIGSVVDFLNMLGRFIFDPAFWRRIGIALFGVVLVAAGGFVLFKEVSPLGAAAGALKPDGTDFKDATTTPDDDED